MRRVSSGGGSGGGTPGADGAPGFPGALVGALVGDIVTTIGGAKRANVYKAVDTDLTDVANPGLDYWEIFRLDLRAGADLPEDFEGAGFETTCNLSLRCDITGTDCITFLQSVEFGVFVIATKSGSGSPNVVTKFRPKTNPADNDNGDKGALNESAPSIFSWSDPALIELVDGVLTVKVKANFSATYNQAKQILCLVEVEGRVCKFPSPLARSVTLTAAAPPPAALSTDPFEMEIVLVNATLDTAAYSMISVPELYLGDFDFDPASDAAIFSAIPDSAVVPGDYTFQAQVHDAAHSNNDDVPQVTFTVS